MTANKTDRGEKHPPRIVFLNQYAGPLFRELAEDLVDALGAGELYSGHTAEIGRSLHPGLSLVACPDQRTKSGRARLTSWAAYMAHVLPALWRRRKTPLLFIVSNPPTLPWLGWLARRLWGQRYALLIYDVYPDMLVRFAGLSESGLLARAWRWLNRRAFERAEVVIAIGEFMARLLEKMYDPAATSAGKTVVIPNWADTEVIRPLDKASNPFAQAHGQVGKLTVLYAGTLGLKHNVTAMIQAAQRLKDLEDVHFFFIGRGAGYVQMEALIRQEQLNNTTLLPFQPESELPNTLTVGEVAVVAVDRGGEGIYVPGKTYYALAAGSALLVLSSSENEVTQLVKQHSCGVVVSPQDTGGFIQAVRRFHEDREFLEICRRNARQAAETYYSRKVCTPHYVEILRRYFA